MAEAISESKVQELQFIELVYSFQQMAMVALGKLVNPMTNQVERHLPQAKSMIDTLRMLRAKTRGNLSETEQKMLDQIILTLELNYVDEVARGAPSKGESPSMMGPNVGTRDTGGAGGADPVSKPSETPPTSEPSSKTS